MQPGHADEHGLQVGHGGHLSQDAHTGAGGTQSLGGDVFRWLFF